MSRRYVTLGSGQRVTLATYAKVWRRLLNLPPGPGIVASQGLSGWGSGRQTRDSLLRDFRAGMHDRINMHDPAYGRGRKWSYDWQREAMQTARAVNTPRLVVRWVPAEFRDRLAHRLYED